MYKQEDLIDMRKMSKTSPSNEDDDQEDHESSTNSGTEKIDWPWEKLLVEVINNLSSDYERKELGIYNGGTKPNIKMKTRKNSLLINCIEAILASYFRCLRTALEDMQICQTHCLPLFQHHWFQGWLMVDWLPSVLHSVV